MSGIDLQQPQPERTMRDYFCHVQPYKPASGEALYLVGLKGGLVRSIVP